MSSNGAWRGQAWAVVVVAIAAGFLILLVAALLAFIAKRQRKKRRLVSRAETTDESTTASRTERRSEGGLGAANRRQVFESGACTNPAYEGAESDPDVKILVGPSGPVKGQTWLPKQSDVFPVPSAPRRSESAHSIGGDPRKRGPRGNVRPPQGQSPEDRRGRGDEEDEDKDYAEETMEESREDVRVVPEKRRYLREKSTTKRRRRPPGKLQMHPSSTLRLEDPLPRRRPPSPQEDLMGSEGEWTFSPVPLHKSMASPTSYLSMPSVRAFPKGANIPEPLALVLEGNRHPAARDSVSVRHLDIYPEASAFEPHRKGDYARYSRHGSFDEDPGVLGPKVFEVVRRERELRRQSSLVIGGSRGSLRLPEENIILPLGEGARLRKRFHDLLDDTLLLFGKRYGEQSKTEKRKEQNMYRVLHGSGQSGENESPLFKVALGHPASDMSLNPASAGKGKTTAEEPLLGYLERPQRPKTSMSRPITADVGSHGWSAGQRRSRVASAGPRGAWGPTDSVNSPVSSGRVSSTISLFTRPLSAGPFHSVTPIPPSIQHDSPPPPAPTVDTNLVLVDAQMPASDPAIPLIQAIKAELRKFHPHDTLSYKIVLKVTLIEVSNNCPSHLNFLLMVATQCEHVNIEDFSRISEINKNIPRLKKGDPKDIDSY
ncbi:hypothetical protein J437_LFUL016610 [Ladona fulva]|uniref:Uncharacterized protein n=1 Tax=Ladona fulva TaxID=123851 RepID=A0A8K0KNT1_LADFU|nr:hypothetical protein J437_LFUL016610 [Ladona fulva]